MGNIRFICCRRSVFINALKYLSPINTDMTGFVYRWTNTVNGKWYIGSHKGSINDGYRHSSEVMLAAEAKYGKDKFVRKILYKGNDYRGTEAQYLNEHDAANNRISYNRTNITGSNCVSEETRKKMSKTRKGRKRKPFSEEWKQNLSKAHKGNPGYWKGKNHSDETKEKIRKIRTGSKQSKETIQKRADKQRGRKRSEETKRKISETLKGHTVSDETREKIRESLKRTRAQKTLGT